MECLNKLKLIDSKISSDKDFYHIFQNIENVTSNSISISFLNPFSYLYVLLDQDINVNYIDLFFIDGILLVKLHNLFHKKKVERVSFDFSSIASYVFDYASNHNLKLGLIGATEEELNRAINNLKKLYPSLNIIYKRHGYFYNENDYNECFKELSKLPIDLLLVGMGTPYQEKMIQKIKLNNINIPLTITCGGFFTQTSIKPDYYHPLIKKLGLRWLQRAFLHKHVRKKLIMYPKSIIFYIICHLKVLINRKN